MSYETDNDASIPPLNRARNVKYPWAGMEIGDSFLVDTERHTIASAASKYGLTHGFMYSIKEDAHLYRVTRTK